MKGRVLVVDDDRAMCEMLASRLGKRDYDVDWRTSGAEALARLGEEDFDVVVTDLNMGGMSGVELCRRIAEDRPDVPVVLITAFGSLEAAIAGIRAGAYDFITKPFDVEALVVALDRAIDHRRLRAEVRRLRRVVEAPRFDEILGRSPAMLALFDLLERVAPTDVTVLVTGESGTGKELVARALHQRSPRKDGPFVAINCAAVPEALLESELFGHTKGAFTDAHRARTGLFQQADRGTLFLDEIGDLPLSLQPKLLRALQERRVRPVGGDTEVPIDVRVVCATHRDLVAEVAAGRFREDLYWRVDVVHVAVPPLRERAGDALLLARHFLDRAAARSGRRVTGLSEGAARRVLAYGWPGNVRELENAIERAVALTRHEEILADDLPARVRDEKAGEIVLAYDDPGRLLPLEEVEKRHILNVLAAVGGNRSLAANVLGLDRKTLYRKLKAWGVAGGAPEDEA